MKSLIIGGAGFVGKYLIRHLRDDLNWSVYVSKLAHEKIEEENINIFDLNILNCDEIKSLLDDVKPDCIFHLAAQSSVALSWKNPALTVDINVKGTVNLLEAIKNLTYKPKVLLIGSGEEYGHLKSEEIPVNEENVLRPGNIYAATKAVQNMIGKIYADAYDMDIIMVRAFNHIGPEQAPIFVVSDFCNQVAEIEKGLKSPVIHVGNLSARRDFTDVRDVVVAYSLLIEKGKSGTIYNIGTGKAVEIREILNMILKLSKCNIDIVVEESRMRPIDILVIEADISRLQKDTNWKPKFNLGQTLEETLNYWRKK